MADGSNRQKLILVTGPSGAGRSTAIRALEDGGFEVIDNLPLSLLSRLLDGPPLETPLALGLDVRNRDFTVDRVIQTIDTLRQDDRLDLQVLFMDCAEDVLVRRYSETRRRHPLAGDAAPEEGIKREREMLTPVRARADVLVDTSEMTPHDARAEVQGWFIGSDDGAMAVTVQSFSYKRGIPLGADLVFDCRFLRNPHWEPTLRRKDGRDSAVADYVRTDKRFERFYNSIIEMTDFLLPGYVEEGKTHLSIAFGCTGGQHRSVALTEMVTKALAERGWPVSIRHREIERRADKGAGN